MALLLQLGDHRGGARSLKERRRKGKVFIRVLAFLFLPITVNFPSVRYYHDNISRSTHSAEECLMPVLGCWVELREVTKEW